MTLRLLIKFSTQTFNWTIFSNNSDSVDGKMVNVYVFIRISTPTLWELRNFFESARTKVPIDLFHKKLPI